MKYYTYWSISDLPTNSIKSFEVCMWIAIFSIITWLIIKLYKKRNEDYEKSILLWTIGIVSIFSATMFIYLKFFTKDDTEERIQALLLSSEVAKVEGLVSNFKTVRSAQKSQIKSITFKVDSVDFKYNDAALFSFNTFTKTGIFRDDLPVRITYGKLKHEILKVEIADKYYYSP